MSQARAGLLALSALGFAGLSYFAYRHYAALYPPYWVCLAEPERYQGRTLSTGFEPVIASTGDSFTIKHGEVPFRVRTSNPPTMGTHANVRGVVQRDGTLLALETIAEPHYAPKRAGQWIASALSLALLAWFVFRCRRAS